MKPEKKMNHRIRESSKNLLFLVKDLMLTTASTTAAYAGKMLCDRAWLLRFTNWMMGIWAAAWQSHESVINLALHSLLSREASAIFAGVEHSLATWQWCLWSWHGRSKVCGMDLGETDVTKEGLRWPGLSIMEKTNSRSPDLHRYLNRKMFSQRFPWENEWAPCGLASTLGEALEVCLLWPAPPAAQSSPLVSQGVQADIILHAHVRVHLSFEWVCHPRGSPQPTAGCMHNADRTPARGLSSLHADPGENNI